MRILWAKANKLLPLHSGGDIRSFHILKYLSAHHDVTFLSYYDGAQDEKYESQLNTHFPSAIALSTGKSTPRSLDYLRRLSSPHPYAVSRFQSPIVAEKINALLRNGTYDVAIADFLDAAINFSAKSKTPRVLFQHNVESEIWRRHAATATNPAKRLMYKTEFNKMLRYEQKIVGNFDHVIAVSENDRQIMQQWTEASRITVVPTGVDVAHYRPLPNDSEPAPIVMFIGAMDWEPNVDAVEFFCAEMWNRIVTEIPAARFLIVGRNPDRRVQKLASPSVEITGRVESVAEYLRQAAVVVVPLRIGGGTRLKIYEAMAAAKAVVSTTVGAEGLDVAPGKDILIADEPHTFADSVATLLQDANLRRRYEQAALATAAKYDWAVIAAKFAAVLEAESTKK